MGTEKSESYPLAGDGRGVGTFLALFVLAPIAIPVTLVLWLLAVTLRAIDAAARKAEDFLTR